jgi:UDP-N-acetylglucosamine--N-acetylmuramyl-(pentapeptide) pyrophosphoryl-undecaprenol N-acetylglucosamine transferase
LLGIPLVIHEQNAVPGMANRLLSRIARRVLEAFPGSFPPQINARAVGNPVRPEIVALAQPDQHPAQDHATPRVLVIGGSLGAQVLNETVPLAVAASGMEIEIWHQTGRGKLDATNALYRQMGIDADLSEFINDMAAAYGWADLVICRAGALTVSELAAAGVASILVPYAYAVDDHQTHNARYLSDSGAALLMPQSDLNGESLGRALRQLLSDRDGLAKRAMSARRLGVLTAAADVADVCEEVMAQ